MSLYSTNLDKVGTFTYQPWSGNGILTVIAEHKGKRYIYADDGVPVPTSPVATYQLANLTVELITEMIPLVIGVPDRLRELKAVYNTGTKSKIEIPKWANCPQDYTPQIPREFDEWDGSLWITNTVLRNAVLKKRKLIEINHDLEVALSALRVEYPESEIMSWTKQENEARAWLRDNTRATPLIDLIASQRGLDKALLINKVIQKSDQYSFAVGSAIGRRQMLEDQVKLVAVGQESKLDQIKF